MPNPNNQQDAGSESRVDLSKFDVGDWQGRIREGKTRKGGVNDAPKTPRPNVRPKPQTPQKPTGASENGGDRDSDE
jgi:hypothetical protein